MENNNKLFGICGSSGSGKSFIVKYVLENLSSDNVSVIYQDNYYKKREEQTKDANGNYNFPQHTLLISLQGVHLESQ